MIFKKTYKYLLKPNHIQRQLFAKFAGAARWIFNHGVERKSKAYEDEGKTLSYYDLNNELPSLKENESTAWLNEIHSQVLQQSLKDVDNAFQHFFRRVSLHEKPGYPKFKRKGERDSFRYPQGHKVEGNHVYLPKTMVRFKKTREIEGTIKQVTIVKEAEHWYVCFSCEIEREMPVVQLSEASAIGIDVGLTHYATLAKGFDNVIEEIENPRFLRRSLPILRHLNKNLSRKKFRSKNWYKAKLELQDFHIGLKNCRKDFAHKLSTQIVKNHDIIGVESLSVALLMQSGQTHLARSIADAGWRQFLDCLAYKARERGKALVPVDRWFAGTQICSGCHARNQLQLSDRVFRCECSLEIGRDVNAAINIKEEAIAKYRAAGMSVLKLVELSPGGKLSKQESLVFRRERFKLLLCSLMAEYAWLIARRIKR